MTPGPVEEAGETARTLVGAFKENPFTLALVLMNLALIGFLYLSAGFTREEHNHDIELLYSNRREVAQLLARCNFIAPPPQQQ